MIRHIVLIKSGDGAEVEAVLRDLPSLVGVVPGLVGVEVGRDFTGKHRGYTHLFILDFADRDGLRVWADHPAHAPIRSTLMRIAEMIVFDYEV